MSAGFAPDEFWRITLREYVAQMDGAARRLARDHRDRMHLALTIATLDRVKKLPRLADLTGDGKKARAATPRDMMAAALRWDQAINKR